MEGFCRVGESRASRAGAAGAGNNKTGCTDVLPFTHIDRVAGREEDLLVEMTCWELFLSNYYAVK